MYLWLDVVLAAMWRGDWAPFEATLREGLACASHADATGEEAGEIADELLTDFRYARDRSRRPTRRPGSNASA